MSKTERDFLHDLGGPIGAACFLIDVILEDLRAKQASSDPREELEEVRAVLEKIKITIDARRTELKRMGAPKGELP